MAASAARCPSPEELEWLLGEALADADRTVVEAHIQTCSACQQRLERLIAPTELPARPPTVLGGGDPQARVEPDPSFLERMRQLPLPSATSPEADEHAPSHLGPYEILGKLGRGGMGTVYRARHRELDKVVALKVLPANRVDEAVVARFRNEMKAAGRLSHPNIVTAHDAGRVGGTYYLAMDFVDGADLHAVVGRLGPLPLPDACELIRQAAVGLQHACECGLAHRDVKPSNLMLTRGGVVKVLDLGLARSLTDLPASERLTMTGVLLGTADYVAPEQIDRAHEADARADVYGLGGTLYFLLTGFAPFADRATWWEKLRAHTDAPIPPVRPRRPDVPAGLAALLERMLAKEPADRPATPGEVADALRPFAEGADAAGLLTRVGKAALRPALPDTAPTVDARRPRLRGTATRYILAAAVGALIALLAVAPFLGAGRGPESLGGGPPNTQPTGSEVAEEPEGVHLTYGPYGPHRPDHKVLPGEQVDMEFVVRRVGKNRKGEVDITIAGEVVDQEGKKVHELLPVPRTGPLYPDGSTLTSRVSFDLARDQRPGDYRIRARFTDKVTGRVADFAHPVYVLRPEFGAVRLRLTLDKDGKWPAGGHLRVGQQFFVQGRVVNPARDDGGVSRLTIKVWARDPDGRETMPEPAKAHPIEGKVPEGGGVNFDEPLRTIMAGEAVVVVELEDRVDQKKVAYELPVVIDPLQSVSFRAFTREP
jgi:hypothetical protein